MTKTVLVYDDSGVFKDHLLKTLSKGVAAADGFEVKPLSDDEFRTGLQILKSRAEAMRAGSAIPGTKSCFDSCDILVVDFDLLGSVSGDFLTSDHVAYVARCYSTVGLIVEVNRFHSVDFDLTLRGHLESFADVNTNADYLGNARFWGGSSRGFSPWCWSGLPQLLADTRKLISDVRGNLDVTIAQALGFDSATISLLSKTVVEFLGAPPDKTTFRKFATDSPNGLRRHDAPRADDDALARIAATRISRWLRESLLVSQDILVDAPHLVSRFPSLVKDRTKKVSDWNSLCSMINSDRCTMLSSVLSTHRFTQSRWLPVPAWWWPKVVEDTRIDEVASPWDVKDLPFVFCEDDSKFHKRSETKEFVADVDSPFSLRFIKDFRPAVRYSPEMRLSL